MIKKPMPGTNRKPSRETVKAGAAAMGKAMSQRVHHGAKKPAHHKMKK
jgi:hypothetical protein